MPNRKTTPVAKRADRPKGRSTHRTQGRHVPTASPKLETLISRLRNLARASDPLTLYLILAVQKSLDLASEESQTPSPAVMEHVTYHLMPLLNESRVRLPTPKEIGEAVGLCDEVFDKAVDEVVGAMDLTPHDPRERLIFSAALHLEVMRGSAYPLQTRSEIKEVAGRFDAWFAARGLLPPTRAVDLLTQIMYQVEERTGGLLEESGEVARVAQDFWRTARALSRERRRDDQRGVLERYADEATFSQEAFASALIRHIAERVPVAFEDLQARDPATTRTEWDALLVMMGLDLTRHASLQSASEVRRWPVYVLPDGRVLLLDLSHALDELWWRYEDEAKTDPTFFGGRFGPHKGQWLETQVGSLLRGVFGDAAFLGVDYPDPERSDGGTAETDVLVRWGSVLLIGEIKAKRFRPEDGSGRIHFSRLRGQLRDNVEDAANQAARVLRYLQSTAVGRFVERSSRRVVVVDFSEITQVIVLSVTQHHLGMLNDRLGDLKALGHFKRGVVPVTVSVGDLEVICTFSEAPEVFLHYLTVRTRHLERKAPLVSTELDLFGLYLKDRLYPGQFDRPDVTLSLLGGQDPFDAWMESRAAGREDRVNIGLRLPAQVRRVLEAVRHHPDRNTVSIAFALLDAPEEVLQQLEGVLEDLVQHFPLPAPFRRVNVGWPGTTLVVLGTTHQDALSLSRQLELRTQTESYRTRARRGVGLAVRIDSSGWSLEAVAYREAEWQQDGALEAVLEQDRPLHLSLAAGAKTPGRNERCPCGSGRKFKHCCLSRLESNRD